MNRHFVRDLLTVAVVLVLAVPAFAAVASGSPNSLTNTGEVRRHVSQGHHLTPPADLRGTAILYAPSEADNAAFRTALADCTGAVVDYFDAMSGTPDAATLIPYSCVITWVNYAYPDPTLMGDNLADYVDAGGQVILGQWCYNSGQTNALAGRIMTSDYCPITAATSFDAGSYNLDGSDCVHDGVGVYSTDYLDRASLVASAVSDGTFSNPSNSLAVAWRADRMVYYSPGNTGGTYGTGDWALVTCNMFLCTGGGGLPRLITGPGPAQANPTRVRTWDPASPDTFVNEWDAYGVDQWGANVACGDLGGRGRADSVDEVITGPGPGAVFGPHVRAFDATGTPVPGVSFIAYGTLKYGVNVSAGDIDGDGIDEIVTGAGPGAVFGPHVRGWNVDGGTAAAIPGVSYLAYGTHKWGVNVSCGDIDGDGYDEIITGAGPGAVFGPHVRGWNVDGGTSAAIPGVSFLAYGTHKFGVNVACGDVDDDGMAEILTGPGPGSMFGAQVKGWNYDGSSVTPIAGISFVAYPGALYGARVAAVDLDGDGYDEILTMPGPDPSRPAQVRAWNVDGGTAAQITTIDFDAYDDLGLVQGGKIAGGEF